MDKDLIFLVEHLANVREKFSHFVQVSQKHNSGINPDVWFEIVSLAAECISPIDYLKKNSDRISGHSAELSPRAKLFLEEVVYDKKNEPKE